MSEFDHGTERCYDCDGHWRHFPGCRYYDGEPILDVQARVELRAMIARDAAIEQQIEGGQR